MNTVSRNKLLFIILMICIAGVSSADEINIRKHMLRSALVPGWGELSAGNKSGLAFLASEIILISSRFYFVFEADLKAKASYNFAVKYAHIDPELDLTDDQYYDMTRYLSSGYNTGGYNANIVEVAKSLYPDDLQAQTQYIQENAYNDLEYWNWDDEARQKDYSILRKRITQYGDYVKAITGAIIANHIFSAINSFRVGSHIKKLNAQVQFSKSMEPMLTIQYKF